MFGIIYKITNLVNGKIYVGQTKYPLNERLKQHFLFAKKGRTYLAAAIRKHGVLSFKTEEVAQGLLGEELDELERKYILEFESYLPEIGYNTAMGGEGCGSPNDATRLKLSTASSAVMTKEERDRLSAERSGKPKTEKHCAAISAALTRTHCKRGHALEGSNIHYNSYGGRQCRICFNEKAAANVIRRREQRQKAKQDGRPYEEKRPPKTHCNRGHELTEENTAFTSIGYRRCRICARERQRVRSLPGI